MHLKRYRLIIIHYHYDRRGISNWKEIFLDTDGISYLRALADGPIETAITFIMDTRMSQLRLEP